MKKMLKIEKGTLIGDKSLPDDIFSDVFTEPNEIRISKKKSLADIYEEIFFKAKELIDNPLKRLLGLREGLKTFRQLMADPASEKLRSFSFSSKKKIKYVDILYKEEIAYLEAFIDRQKTVPIDFLPKEGLGEVIHKDFISQFGEIEKELISRGFLNENYEWQRKRKKCFCDFLVVILSYGYIAKKIFGKNVSEPFVRRFFELRYNKPKKFLSEMFKKSRRSKFEDAIITFSFISAPQEKKEITSHQHKPMEL